MTSRLKDFALLVLSYLSLKFAELLESQKSSFSIFPVVIKVKQNDNKKNIRNFLTLKFNNFSSNFNNKSQTIFDFSLNI